MILKLSKTKRLSFYRKTDIYIGEKDFDKIQILIPSEVDENDTSELTFKLHLVNERGEYAIRTLTVEQEGTKVVGSTSITADLTSVAQEFSVYIEMVKGNDEVIGKTNVLEIKVNPLPDEQGEIIPEDIERQRVIVSSTNPPSEAHKKYLLNALWVNYVDKTQFVLTSIDESQAPEKYLYTWERNNNHVVVSTEVAPEYTPNNIEYKYSEGDIWIQTNSDLDKIISISVCTGYTTEPIDNETWRYNYTWAILNSGVTNYNELNNKPQINNITLQGNKTSTDLGLQDKLTAGENITISNDNVISASGGVTDYTELENLPYILYSFSTGAFESVPLTGTLLAGNYLRITKYSTRFTIDVNTQRVLTTEHQLNLNLNDRGEYPFIKSARAQNVTNLPSFVQAKYNSDITLIQFAGNAISTWLQLLIWIDNSLTPHYAKRLYANNGFFAWEETKNITIVSGVVNANGTITFTDSGGNTFTTTGSSVIGPQGDDYVLTAQDKSDIADIVLSELPTTEGVLYGN